MKTRVICCRKDEIHLAAKVLGYDLPPGKEVHNDEIVLVYFMSGELRASGSGQPYNRGADLQSFNWMYSDFTFEWLGNSGQLENALKL